MLLDCRLIVDAPAEGAWNMAVDEALLESAADAGAATLRLYRWREPTLSLGYFQAHSDRAGHAPSASLPCVRRSTGGGALVHDREVTYSLTLPPAALAGRDTRALYCDAHRAVIAAIVEGSGADGARLSLCDPEKSPAAGEEPFLCFLRRSDGDLLVGPPHPAGEESGGVRGRHKVTGSAQRKRRGALLQHGGVLLARSDAAPELPGLLDLGLLTAGNEQKLIERLAERLPTALGLRVEAGELTDGERHAAGRLVEEKHGHPAWVERR
ncbi:MAG: lipoate--protein ligase [Planctomycetota bacterium]